MKAGLEKSRILALVGGAALILVGGGLAWFGLGGLGERHAEAQVLREQMGNPALVALLKDPAGAGRATRDAAELQKLTHELGEKDAFARQWAQATQELAGEGQDWAKDPGRWKDRLIAVQSELQKEAKAGKLGLAPDFYLGLDGFRQKSPTVEEVPELALHLSVAGRLVRRLMEARQIREQYPTACELLALTGPGSMQEKGPQDRPPPLPGPGAKPAPPTAQVKRKTFRVEIRSSPEVLYEYVRLLTADSALFIVTDLLLANEKQTFPLRSEIAKKFSKTPALPGGGAVADQKEKKRLLEILAGEESLNTTLVIDFVAWENPKLTKGGGASASAEAP